jgi:quinoprotein glucose dehydrogenase
VHDGLTGMTERGMNYWESKDGKDRRILYILADYLQELDATTGKLIRIVWNERLCRYAPGPAARSEFHARAVRHGRQGLRRTSSSSGRHPGEAYFSAPGDLRAYNVVTGKLAGSSTPFRTLASSATRHGRKDAWKYMGGANTWGEVSIDAARGIAYFPTGSATFDFYGADRVGDNLFGTSLIALDARTGKRLWHFQTVHHDLWDYDNVAAPMLTTINKDGQKIDVVAMAGRPAISMFSIA